MKKLLGLTLGGVKQKIFNLVLIFLIALIGVFGGVSTFQAKQLTSTVNDASKKQQTAIENVSNETMHQVINLSMTRPAAIYATRNLTSFRFEARYSPELHRLC